jgi:hypothetical protein
VRHKCPWSAADLSVPETSKGVRRFGCSSHADRRRRRVGLHRYLGVFGEGGWGRQASDTMSGCYRFYCASVHASLNSILAGAGWR